MPDRTIVVARRFRGPETDDGATANGGYFCGLVAGAAPRATTIEIRARAGVPLDRPLTVRGDGHTVEVLDDGALVARSAAERLPVRAPAPPALEIALEASRRFEAHLDDGSVRHTFPECFVCGHRRAPGDGLRIFAGPVSGAGLEGGEVRVAGWTPDPTFLDDGRPPPPRVRLVRARLSGRLGAGRPRQHRHPAGGDPGAGGRAPAPDRDGLARGPAHSTRRQPAALRGHRDVRRERAAPRPGRGDLGGAGPARDGALTADSPRSGPQVGVSG